MATRINMPTKNSLIDFWISKIAKKELKHNEHECFACNSIAGTQKCHIKPVIEGGSNEVSNIHLLCKECHIESECLIGTDYWKWFWFKDKSNSGSYLRLKNIAKLKNISLQESQDIAIQNIGLRTKQGLSVAKSKGVKLGTPKNLTDKAKKEGVKAIIQNAKEDKNNKNATELICLYVDKGMNYSDIAKKLNENGHKTRHNKEFAPMTVSRLYKRAMVAV